MNYIQFIKIGKSYRNVYAGSNSVSYRSPHDRGFAKKKKRHSHKQLRVINNKCDTDINNKISSEMYMNYGCGSGYYDKKGNIPNIQYIKPHDFQWIKECSLIETLKNCLLEDNLAHCVKEYIISTLKQLERRNEIGFFYGFHK